jgi:ABC-2 type transport system ATP-binding protein
MVFRIEEACNNRLQMLQIQGLSKRYGQVIALDGISLQVAPGEFFGLLGPNGAGKSTLMSLVANVQRPDAGEIRIGNAQVSDRNSRARQALGLAPQGIALYKELTASQNLSIFGEIYGLRGSQLRARVDEMLHAVQLTDRAHDAVRTFSGGMQRRLNLVAALLHRPQLLLCDEPTVGVDPQSRNAIFDFLQARVRDGLTVIYSTHYMEEAERLCSRIGIIDHGKIIATGTLDELLRRLPFEDEIRFPMGGRCDALATRLATEGEIAAVDGMYRFRPPAGYRLSSFFLQTESMGLPSALFSSQRPTLEALFLHLTGQQLRE